jgi:hypothetical protein
MHMAGPDFNMDVVLLFVQDATDRAQCYQTDSINLQTLNDSGTDISTSGIFLHWEANLALESLQVLAHRRHATWHQ